jgi:predicted O-methyltransferase YrrM
MVAMRDVDALFLELYGRLPRAGPGDAASTLRALEVVRRTLDPRLVLDAGCGPGAHTLVLAEALPAARILAVDLLEWMVERTQASIRRAGLTDRVRAEARDMLDCGLAPGTVDLVWCEAAVYSVGVRSALETWRGLLAQDGHVVFSEVIWSGAVRPAAAREFWAREYPAMTDGAGVQAQVEAAGYHLLESFPLPEPAWWRAYYQPLLERVGELRPQHADDPDAQALLDEAVREAELRREHAQAYEYRFFVTRPA